MKILSTTLVTLISLVILSACATTNAQYASPKRDAGLILGSIGGAVIGSQFGKGHGRDASIAVGTLLGALIGHGVGESLDHMDMTYHKQASLQTLNFNDIGQPTQWTNHESGHSGMIVPTRNYQVAGHYCREFTQSIYIGKQVQEGYGKACRQADGSWQIQ